MASVRGIVGRGIVAVGMTAALLTAQAPSQASAHSDSIAIVGFTGELRGTVWWSNNHRSIEVCDRKADNEGIYVEFYDSNGGYHRLDDENGAASPCYDDTTPGLSRITDLRGVWGGGTDTGWLAP